MIRLENPPDVYTTTTSAELDTSIANSTLIPEQWYLITDYQTIDFVRQQTSGSGGNVYYTAPVEEIYVQASSANTLYYDGWSKTYEGEKIGYVQDRGDYYEYPFIEYDGGSSGDVEVAPASATVLEIVNNPFPAASDPDLATDFYLNIDDRISLISYTFNSTNKATKWDFDVNGDFEIIDNNFDYTVQTDASWDTASGSTGTQEIDVNSDTEIEAVNPSTDFGDFIFTQDGYSYFVVTDNDTGYTNTYDYANKDQTWEIDGSGLIQLLSVGNLMFADSYYEEGVGNSGSVDITNITATTFDIDASFNIQKGALANGTSSFYIQWSDSAYEEFFWTDYGTTWSVSGNTITLIGNSHNLTTDLTYIESYIYGDSPTDLMAISTSTDASLYMDLYYNEVRQIDLTGDTYIAGDWSFISQALGGLIVNRTLPERFHSIDFDFRGTKFRRYLPTAPDWSSGVYTIGQIVNRSGTIYVKLATDGLTTDPSSASGYVNWGKIATSASTKYFMTSATFSMTYDSTNYVNLAPDLASYVDTDFRGQSGASLFDFTDLTTVRYGWKIINSTHDAVSGCDVVLNSSADNFTLTLSAPFYGYGTLDRANLTITAGTYVIGNVQNTTATMVGCIITTMTYSRIVNMGGCIVCNWSYQTVDGSLDSVFSSTSTSNVASTYNNISGTITYLLSNLNWNNNVIPGTVYKCRIGTRFSSNQIYGTMGGATITAAFEFNKIFSLFGSTATNAGRFYNVSSSNFYDVVREITNSNIGGTTLYNDFYTLSGSSFYGTLQGNNLPLVTIQQLEVRGNMTQCDKIGTVGDTISTVYIGRDFYNVRFTGRTTLTYCRFYASFQNCFFGAGTFASPTDNSIYRNFNYNTFLSTAQYINHISGYVTNNFWQGQTNVYGSAYVTFSMPDRISFYYNTLGDNFNGNTFNAQFQGNTCGQGFGGNTFNALSNYCVYGSQVVANTFSNSLTAVEIVNGFVSSTVGSINQGFIYNKLAIKGSATGGATNVVEAQNVDGIQMFLVDACGRFSIGATSASAQLNVYQYPTGPGRVSNSAGATAVTGNNTCFTNTFKIGDTITIGGQTVTITNIISDTSLTVTPAITNANTSVVYTLTGGAVFMAYGNKRIGVNRIRPQSTFEINAATGDCLRLIYNDADAAATYYADFTMDSSGNLTISPLGSSVAKTTYIPGPLSLVTLNTVAYEDEAVFVDGSMVFA